MIRAILKARVDLLWFGGIGTYVRGPDESDLEVGDKANDAIRVTAAELGAKVVGEGANLGDDAGRPHRLRAERAGAAIRRDRQFRRRQFLGRRGEHQDRAAPAVRSGHLSQAERNELLKAMTDEVARAGAAQQLSADAGAIRVEAARGLDNLANQSRLMAELEARGLLDRKIENLPDDLR